MAQQNNNIFNSLGFKVFLFKKASQDTSYALYENDTKNYSVNSKNQIIEIMSKLLIKDEKLVRDIHYNMLNDKEDKDYQIFATGKKIHISKILISYAIDREVEVVENIGYSPTPQLMYDNEENRTFFNGYQSTPYLEGTNFTGKHKEFPQIDKIIKNLVGNSDKGYKWITQRIAAILQKPHEKLTTGFIFHGEQGTGKGILLDTVLNHILGQNYTSIQNKELESDFNGWNYKKLMVHAVEIHPNPIKDISGSLKNLCSDKYFPLRKMRTEAQKVENFSTIVITSNRYIPIKIDKDDRRWSVFKSKKLKDGDKIYNTLMDTFEEEITNFTKFLWSLDIDYSFVNRPLDNKEKKDLKESCMSSVDSFLSYVNMIGISNIENVFAVDYSFKHDLLLHKPKDTNDTYVNYQELYQYYKEYCNIEGYGLFPKRKFGEQLKFADIETKVVKKDGKSWRGVKID